MTISQSAVFGPDRDSLPTPAGTLLTEALAVGAATLCGETGSAWVDATGIDRRWQGGTGQVKRVWDESGWWGGFPGPGERARFDPGLVDVVDLVGLSLDPGQVEARVWRGDGGWCADVVLRARNVAIWTVPVDVMNAAMARDGRARCRFKIGQDLGAFERR